MATNTSILAWRIPWTEEPGGLQCTGLQRVRHDGSNLAHTHIEHYAKVKKRNTHNPLVYHSEHSCTWQASQGTGHLKIWKSSLVPFSSLSFLPSTKITTPVTCVIIMFLPLFYRVWPPEPESLNTMF